MTSEEVLIAAARRASRRSQYRVSVSPGAILGLLRERNLLRVEVEHLKKRLPPEPPPEKPRIVL